MKKAGLVINTGGGRLMVTKKIVGEEDLMNKREGNVKPYVAPRFGWDAPKEALANVKNFLINKHGEKGAVERIDEMTDKEVIDLDCNIRMSAPGAAVDNNSGCKDKDKKVVRPYVAPTFESLEREGK